MGYLRYALDDSVFFNHDGSNPNTTVVGYPGAKDQLSGYAIRDIKKGEEIFEDYGKYEWPEWLLQLCEEFGSDMSYFEIKSPETEQGKKVAVEEQP